MATEKSYKIKDLGIYGLIREAEVDSNLSPTGSLSDSQNVHYDRKGALTLRTGETILGTTIIPTAYCLGLYDALFSSAGSNCIVTVFGQTGSAAIYCYQTGSFAVTLTGET
jgi:hypothetical protein